MNHPGRQCAGSELVDQVITPIRTIIPIQTPDQEGVEAHIPAPTATATDTFRVWKVGIQEKVGTGIHTPIQVKVLDHPGPLPPRMIIPLTD